MTEILDGGPIYDSLEVCLDGTINEIFKKIAICVERLILSICDNSPIPIAQSGECTIFRRLSLFDNELLSHHSIREFYDRIRMVDGLDYPKAYINYGKNKIEFSEAQLLDSNLVAKVKLTLIK